MGKNEKGQGSSLSFLANKGINFPSSQMLAEKTIKNRIIPNSFRYLCLRRFFYALEHVVTCRREVNR
jgi:hypothetical protein